MSTAKLSAKKSFLLYWIHYSPCNTSVSVMNVNGRSHDVMCFSRYPPRKSRACGYLHFRSTRRLQSLVPAVQYWGMQIYGLRQS